MYINLELWYNIPIVTKKEYIMSRMSELFAAINELIFQLEDGSINLDTAIDSIVDDFGSAMGIEFVYDQFMTAVDNELS